MPWTFFLSRVYGLPFSDRMFFMRSVNAEALGTCAVTIDITLLTGRPLSPAAMSAL